MPLVFSCFVVMLSMLYVFTYRYERHTPPHTGARELRGLRIPTGYSDAKLRIG
jgi:hypothetical protein